MRNFKITIEYDGTNYFGWQRQKDDKRLPTIQSTLEMAAQRLFGKKVHIVGSGRTDAGVHALNQVASFKVDTDIPAKNILRALNTYLPEDILVKDIREVLLSFNARFNAKKKWYRYTVLDKLSTFNRYYAVYYPYKFDIRLMKMAGRIMEVERVYKINISNNREFIHIDVIGKGFLYKMVRRIVGILIDVGRKKINIEDVKQLVSGKRTDREAQTAPAKGLMLMRVYY